MPFNIATFKSRGLVYGGARPSLFSIEMAAPDGIGIDNLTVDKVRFVAKAAELPEMTISQIEVPYFGRKIKVAGERTFGDWTITVMNDEDFSVRAMFESWNNAINRLVANVRDAAVSTEAYKVDIVVRQYAKDGEEIRSYQLIGAFPTQIGAIALGWDTTNNVEEFPVTFAYDYWVPLLETSDKKLGGVNTYGETIDIDGPAGGF